jgi:septal ring factor EnvC (AmiA/AmiB activator)
MNVLKHHFYWAALSVAVCLAAPPVAAAPKGDPAAQQALRKAQGMLRDLTQQKTQLETENTALKEQIKKLETDVKRLEPLQSEVERGKASIESLKGSAGALEHRLGQEQEKFSQFMAKHREMVAQAKKIQGDNQLLVAAVQEREQWIGQCGERNRAMLDANKELVGKYKDKGFFDKLAELEPLTGIGRVEAENVEQDYRYKLQDLQMIPFEDQGKKTAAAAESAEAAAQPDSEEEE